MSKEPYWKAYHKTPQYKAYMKAYHKTEKYISYNKAFRSKAENIAKAKIYRSTPEYKARRNAQDSAKRSAKKKTLLHNLYNLVATHVLFDQT